MPLHSLQVFEVLVRILKKMGRWSASWWPETSLNFWQHFCSVSRPWLTDGLQTLFNVWDDHAPHKPSEYIRTMVGEGHDASLKWPLGCPIVVKLHLWQHLTLVQLMMNQLGIPFHDHFCWFNHDSPPWLVISIPLKNISQLWWFFPMYGKKGAVPNHQPVPFWLIESSTSPRLCAGSSAVSRGCVSGCGFVSCCDCACGCACGKRNLNGSGCASFSSSFLRIGAPRSLAKLAHVISITIVFFFCCPKLYNY